MYCVRRSCLCFGYTNKYTSFIKNICVYLKGRIYRAQRKLLISRVYLFSNVGLRGQLNAAHSFSVWGASADAFGLVSL